MEPSRLVRPFLFALNLLIYSAFNAQGQAQAPMPYANPAQAQIPIYQYSFYLQPWKSYMDTWPGSQLLNCIGINFNVSSEYALATARALAQCGFKEARIGIGWANYQYNNPSQIGATQLPGITTALQALKAYGIRPLIMLNADSSDPCPAKNFATSVIMAAAVGATTIQLSNVSGVVPQYTGLIGQAYQSAFPLITAVNSVTGVCTLSAPLKIAVPAGPLNLTVLLFHPLSTGGQANIYSQQTMQGWASYVRQTCAFLQSIFGNAFDLEIWNELTSASQFLDDNNYYSTPQAAAGTLSYSNHGFTRTGVEVLEPIAVDIAAAEYPGVRVIDGFSNQRPWDAGSTMWPGEHGFSRHFYTALDTTDAFNGWKGVSTPPTPISGGQTVLNALGQADNPLFVPSFTMSCPEAMWMGTDYLYLIRDLQPFPSLMSAADLNGNYTAFHWRGSTNLVGQTAQVWESETNCSRYDWTALLETQLGIPATNTELINLSHYVGAKALLRMYTFYAHKGLETACAFAASDGDLNLSVIPDAFFTALDATNGAYSSAAWAQIGTEMSSIKYLTNMFTSYAGAPGAFTVQPLAVSALSEPTTMVEWAGDSTAAHPTRNNSDDFGVFPFQLNQNTYAVGYYVVTHNIVQNWGVDKTDVLDPVNYRMPDEAFFVTLSGLSNGLTAQLACNDPLTTNHPAAVITARTQNSIQVRVLATDYPRFLLMTSH